jgi:YD repeat-containing protein
LLERIAHSGADSQSETIFSYAPSGALQAIHTDGTEIARYGYDRQHRLSDAWAMETGALTFDWTDDGQPKKLQFESAAINIESDAHGRVTRFSRGYGQSMRVGYDGRDRVISIDHGAAGASAYTYGVDKFRTSSIYDGVDTVIYAYDVAGNVRGFAYENADGSSRQDEYIVGERNELQKVKSSHNPEFDFVYDTLGRATRVLAAGRELQIDYDEQSRVTKTTLDGRVTMEADYAQDAFDVAHHVDDRTFRSRATQRPGSGIIGSIHEIVYTRPLYTPWQVVAFDAEMNRFVLRPLADAHPERLLIDGFARRNLPLTPDSSHGAITHLDKPSSALFVPPELVSANCFVCNVVIFGHTLTVNNQFEAVLAPGENAIFRSNAYASGCQAESGQPIYYFHQLYHDDLGYASAYTVPPFYANGHTYSYEGSFEPFATMQCSCGTFGISWASADAYVCQQPPDSLALSTASGWPNQEPFERGATFYCKSNGAVADKFRDSFGQYYSGFTPTDDPCAVGLSTSGSGITGAIHSHPYFYNSAQYHAGIGCFEDQDYISAAELTALNNANKNFSTCPTCDPAWSSTTQTPLYLKTPTGSQVKRRDVNGSVSVIFP